MLYELESSYIVANKKTSRRKLFESITLGLGGLTREDLQCAYRTFGLDVGIEECDEIVLHMDTTGEGNLFMEYWYKNKK